MSIAEDLYENSTSQSAILNGGKSLIDSYLDSSSTATLGSRSSTVLKLRRSYAVMRDAHHHGLVNAPQSLSQLRNDFISRKHPLITSSSLPSLSSGGSSLLGHQQRRSLRRPRKGLQPAPRTKAEKELLYDSKRGSIFSKYKPQSGLPQRKSHKKGTHPAGFAGKRTKQKEKLYKLNAGDTLTSSTCHNPAKVFLASTHPSCMDKNFSNSPELANCCCTFLAPTNWYAMEGHLIA